jgi:peptide/nickel transport system permease protein
MRNSRGVATLFKLLTGSASSTAAVVVLLVYVVTALVAIVLPQSASLQIDTSHILAAPSLAHLFGTDELGRDQLARVIQGARTSLFIILPAAAIAAVVGSSLGLIAGYVGSALDNVVMRITDIFFAFPPVLLALAFVAGLGPGQTQLVIAIAVVYTPMFVRIARGPTLEIRERRFVAASVVSGGTARWIITRHILPNVAPYLIVQVTLTLAWALLTEASLSFLGLGVQPPLSDWGSMTNEGRDFLLLDPWLAVFPGAAIVIVVLSLNLLGDKLREIADPRFAQRLSVNAIATPVGTPTGVPLQGSAT